MLSSKALNSPDPCIEINNIKYEIFQVSRSQSYIVKHSTTIQPRAPDITGVLLSCPISDKYRIYFLYLHTKKYIVISKMVVGSYFYK